MINASLAQVEERWTENPCVPDSTSGAGTILKTRKNIDKNKVKELYLNGLGYIKIGKIFNVSRTYIQKIIRKFNISDLNRIPKGKMPLEDLINLYKSGWGVYKIGKKYGLNQGSVKSRLERAGIVLDITRQNKKKPGSRRSRRTSQHDFKNYIKRKCFEKTGGLCELCGRVIGNGKNWQQALYHHKKLVSDGGDASEQNCMVLHPECHKEKFYELHGFEYQRLNNYKRIEIKPRDIFNQELLLDLYLNKRLKTKEIIRIMGIRKCTVAWQIRKLIKNGKIPKELALERMKQGSEKIPEQIVKETLKQNNFNVSRTSKELGITERAVYYKLKKLKEEHMM